MSAIEPRPCAVESAGAQEVNADANATRRSNWTLVAALTVLYTYAYIDRSILTLLVEPIKAHLGISDTQMSLLLGTAFAVFYAVMNIPAGHLVDRLDRRTIVGVATLAWSMMTALCGLAQSFWQIFAGRAGVGLAEAAITPASFCLIREHVPPAQRSRAFSIYAMGPWFGSALSLLLGGALLGLAAQGVFSGIPGVATLRPWQTVLLLIGALGVPLSLLALCIPRKPLGALADQTTLTFSMAYAHMWKHRRVYGLLIAFVTFGAMLQFAKSAWIPALLARQWGMTPSRAGYVLGALNLTCAPIGMMFAGYIMDRLTAKGGDVRRYGLFAASVGTVAVATTPMMPTLAGLLTVHAIGLAFSGVFYVVGAATLAEITPQTMMGKMTAAYLLLQGIVSQSLGPFLVAIFADTVFKRHGKASIGYGLSLSAALVGLLAIASLWLLMRRLRCPMPAS